MIMLELGKAEDEIFKKRQQNELAFKAREKAKRRRSDGYNQYRPNLSLLNNTQFAPQVRNNFLFFSNYKKLKIWNKARIGHLQLFERTTIIDSSSFVHSVCYVASNYSMINFPCNYFTLN